MIGATVAVRSGGALRGLAARASGLPAQRARVVDVAKKAGFKSKAGLRSTVATDATSLLGKSVPSSRAMGASALFGGALAWMKANPFAAQVSIATTKTSLADLLVQKRVEGRETIDWRRNALFIAFGGVYLGVFQWFVYVRGFSRLFPAMEKFCNQSIREKLRNKAGLRALFGQIALDFVLVQPLMYFPVFYMFKTTLEPLEEGVSRVQHAYKNWRANLVSDNLSMCGFWLPMDLVIYSVPLWMRLPLNHAISFAWCCILSILRGDMEEGEAAEAA